MEISKRKQVGTLVLRADSSSMIGTGHIMRCLALAQGWKNIGGSAVVVTNSREPWITDRFRNFGVHIHRITQLQGSRADALETSNVIRHYGAQWVALDGYHFGNNYMKCLQNNGSNILLFDDLGGSGNHHADILINSRINANQSIYEHCKNNTQLLLGPQFVLLRSEFSQWCGWKRSIPAVARKLLVTLGGSDPNNATFKILTTLLATKNFETTIVAGALNENLTELRKYANRKGSYLRVLSDVADMAALMAWADICISAAGTTALELAFMGVPTLLTILADNQMNQAIAFETEGICINLGSSKDLDCHSVSEALTWLRFDQCKRAQMSQKGCTMVDGMGVQRIVSNMTEFLNLGT